MSAKRLKMKETIARMFLILFVSTISACGNDETWLCRVEGNTMYSISSSGNLGAANKACSCSEIRAFELKTFGRVDEAALRNDFGC
tara:strand:+ start:296 stop:553 length:258 start_codon:yes stop_codon:yes gene_type:complete